MLANMLSSIFSTISKYYSLISELFLSRFWLEVIFIQIFVVWSIFPIGIAEKLKLFGSVDCRAKTLSSFKLFENDSVL